MTNKIFALFQKHRRLDDAIRVEQARTWPDVVRIVQLKRLKLAVRDRLHGFATQKTLAAI